MTAASHVCLVKILSRVLIVFRSRDSIGYLKVPKRLFSAPMLFTYLSLVLRIEVMKYLCFHAHLSVSMVFRKMSLVTRGSKYSQKRGKLVTVGGCRTRTRH